MVKIKKMMELEENGDEQQFFPQTHADAVLDLHEYLKKYVIPGAINGKDGKDGMTGPTGSNIIKYDGDIPGDGASGKTATFARSSLQPSDIAKVGDIVFDQFQKSDGVNIGFWRITALSSTSCTVTGLSSGFVIPRGPKGPAGQNATTTANATQKTNGLMSYTDKTKLDTLQIVKITKIKDV